MPEVKNRANVFEIYDCGSKKLVKELNVNSDADQLLILDSIINNADNSKDYTEELSEVEPEYVLVSCGETDETTIYVKIRFSDGKVYREIYSDNESSSALDQGILDCITVTEEDFRSILA